MISKKCDRCDNLYDEYNTKSSSDRINGLSFFNIDKCQQYFKHGPYDLCPKCTEEFMNWFIKENNEDEDQVLTARIDCTNGRHYLELPDGYRLIFDDNGYVGRYNPNLSEVI